MNDLIETYENIWDYHNCLKNKPLLSMEDIDYLIKTDLIESFENLWEYYGLLKKVVSAVWPWAIKTELCQGWRASEWSPLATVVVSLSTTSYTSHIFPYGPSTTDTRFREILEIWFKQVKNPIKRTVERNNLIKQELQEKTYEKIDLSNIEDI